jgi:pimeloyl-ACP methyl ester carboxylesterase
LEEDSVVGKYTWLKLSAFGQTKIFYECAGHGPKHILWLHTAGADSRQFHELMNNKSLQERYTMYAFDMPAHGRSSPGSKQVPQGYANSEEIYIEVIHQVIKKLHLTQPIVSGASMAGHICLAVALRAQEMGVAGVIPVEAAEYLALVQPPYELGGHFNESIINPERVCGMVSPTSTKARKQLIWWIYSSQAARVFQGDLQFYFKGWDGRNRLEHIDTSKCPVYMLTGEYDYSCTPEVSAAAAAKIPGARFEKMDRMGHFPMTEDPEQFLVYLNRALDFIEKSGIS